MNLRFEYEEVPFEAIAALRAEYLEKLREAQEVKLEVLIPFGACHLVRRKGEPVGYFIVHAGETLIEMHVVDGLLGFCNQVLGKFLAAHPEITGAWVKSFDDAFFSHAVDLNTSVRTMGCMVRGYAPREVARPSSIRFTRRLAVAEDLERIMAVEQDAFPSKERMAAAIERGIVHFFEDEGAAVGFVIARPASAGSKHVDLGFAVDTSYRNRGHALFMLKDVADYCLEVGLVPIAGAPAENAESWLVGQRIGMISVHRLLEIRFR